MWLVNHKEKYQKNIVMLLALSGLLCEVVSVTVAHFNSLFLKTNVKCVLE